MKHRIDLSFEENGLNAAVFVGQRNARYYWRINGVCGTTLLLYSLFLLPPITCAISLFICFDAILCITWIFWRIRVLEVSTWCPHSFKRPRRVSIELATVRKDRVCLRPLR